MTESEALKIVDDVVKEHSNDYTIKVVRRRRKSAGSWEVFYGVTTPEGDNTELYKALASLCIGSEAKRIYATGSDLAMDEADMLVEMIIVSAIVEL